jgi:hypothetical protein
LGIVKDLLEPSHLIFVEEVNAIQVRECTEDIYERVCGYLWFS